MRPPLLIVALVLLSAALTEAPSRPPLGVVFVDVAGVRPWDAASRSSFLDDVATAMGWLEARGIATSPEVEELAPRTLAAEELATWDWLRAGPSRLTLYALANFDAPWVGIGPQSLAGAYIHQRAAVLAEYDWVLRQAAIAHELTHAYTLLPDWSACDQIDILCAPGPAYLAGTLGCKTLDALDRPCERTYAPWVEVAP